MQLDPLLAIKKTKNWIVFFKLSPAHAESTKHLMVYSEHFTEENYTNYFVHLGDTEPRKSTMFLQLMTYK